MVSQSIQLHILRKRDTVELERTHYTRAARPTKNQPERMWSMGRMINLRIRKNRHRGSVRLERTRWWTNKGIVQAKQSTRSWSYLLFQSTTRSRRTFSIWSKCPWRNDFDDNLLASALDKAGGHVCRWSFVRKETPDFYQAGGDSRRQATELTCAYQANLKNLTHTLNEKQAEVFLISSLMTQVLKSAKNRR